MNVPAGYTAKSATLRFRVTPAEHAAIRAAAAREGQAVSDWLRTVLIRAIAIGEHLPVRPQ